MACRPVGLEPVGATFCAIVRGLDLRAVNEAILVELHEAWLEYPLLIFPGQYMTRVEQNRFAQQFGALEFPASPISNVERDGTVHSAPDDDIVRSLRGNEGWHHDSTYMPVQAKAAVVTAEIVPAEGGDTGWADMRAAYDALDEDTRARIQNLAAYHSLYYSQGRIGSLPSTRTVDRGYIGYGYHHDGPFLRPLVKVHPETGYPNLVIGRHAHGIVGMESGDSERFLDSLNEQACRPPHVHYHHWTAGDAVLWDNRRLMHRATAFDLTQPRRMWHTRIAGDAKSELALNARPAE